MGFAAVLGLAAGCGGEVPDLGWDCVVPGDLGEGELRATVDGADWRTGTAAWLMAGSSLQVNTEAEDGWRLTVVGQSTEEGQAVEDAMTTRIVPFTIPLETGEEGGWATLYPDDGDSFATESGGGGQFVVVDLEADLLTACFWFPATDGEASVEVTGALAAVPSDL